jgi:hypothetical protein
MGLKARAADFRAPLGLRNISDAVRRALKLNRTSYKTAGRGRRHDAAFVRRLTSTHTLSDFLDKLC